MEAWGGCGPSQPLPVNQYHFTAPTERTPSSSRESANGSHSFIATMIDGGLEMRSLAAVAGRKSIPFSRRRRSGRPPEQRPRIASVDGDESGAQPFPFLSRRSEGL